jgi:hypothetical protein
VIIKLTNSHADFKGKKVLINSDHILSVFESKTADNKKATFVYVDKENTWQVSETVEQIYEMVSK